MGETQILDELSEKLRLDQWWEDLIGQTPTYTGFDLDIAQERLPRTEVTASKEISRKFKDLLSYNESRNIWYLWDGKIHRPCDGDGIAIKIGKRYYEAVCKALDFIQKAIHSMADAIRASAAPNAKKDADDMLKQYDYRFGKHRNFRDRLATDAGLSAIVRTVRTDVDIPSDHFDNDQRWFVMNDWVIDLDVLRTTGQFSFLKHEPWMPITKYFDAEYGDGSKNLGHWDNYLRRAIPNEEMRNYLQVVAGAAFMGQSKLRCIMNPYGPPGSGKSVLIETFFKLGKDGGGYCVMPDSRALTKVSGQNFEQDAMKGSRYVGISEPSHSEKIDDDFVKRVTGDSWVETRTLNVKSSGWVPQCVIFVASNKPLRINTRDKAIVERIHMIEFPVVFQEQLEDGPEIPEERRMIAGLEDLLMEDRTRILVWILQGMRLFVEGGMKLHVPEVVREKSADVVTEASTALRWIQDYVEEGLLTIDSNTDEEFWLPVEEAYMRYKMWAMMNGENKPLPKRFFSQDIENRYGEKTKGKNAKFRGLVPTVEYRRIHDMRATESSGISF